MGKTRRVLVCGDNVALAGVATSLSLDPECEVLGHALPIGGEELGDLHPNALVFELDAVPPAFVYTVSRQLPGLLLIGVDLETNRLFLWTGERADGWTSQDLARAILHAGNDRSTRRAETRQGSAGVRTQS